MQATDLAGCVAGYAGRLHAKIGTGHHVASALGAWMLLALAGPASTGAERVTLETTLGCDAESAAAAAAALLATPQPLVAAACAVWTQDPAPLPEGFWRWRASLPPPVTRGPIPGQAGLDAWARDHTFGLVERFPLRWDPALYLVMASALATKVSWQVPFELTPAAALGEASPWASGLRLALRAPAHGPGHEQFIAVTADAGDVAVHLATAAGGLLVCSVAADPAVPAGPVLAAAHRIATARARNEPVQRRSLADLPLGPGPAWVVREERSVSAQDGFTAVLPAWTAASQHDLADPGLGFAAAVRALAPSDPWTARQAVMARYTRTGFEAAAVTLGAVAMAARLPSAIRRVADLRFGHPYAVVAVTFAGNDPAGGATASPAGEWHGLPVFSAWVAEPAEAE